jgi:hypothetical protein
MNTREFLELLLPHTGWICTSTLLPGNNGFKNNMHQSFDAAVRDLNQMTFESRAAYFGLASYREPKVWDPTWRNAQGEVVGKWRYRTQQNAEALKSFFLDLDVDAADPLKFPSKATALDEFETFRAAVGLPDPMVVDSGGGYHLYWPLHRPVPAAEWRAVADVFKQLCISLKFRADKSLTSDQARVLRAIGGYNFKRDARVRLISATEPIDFSLFKKVIEDGAANHGIGVRPGIPAALGASAPAGAVDVFGDGNLESNDPLNMGRIAFHCAQIGDLVGSRGATAGEQIWRAGLGIAKFAEPQDLAYRAISDGHPDYDESRTVVKIANWRTGPTACAHFHQQNPLPCEGCHHWGKLTSPAQLGRMIREAAAPEVEIVDAQTGVVTVITLPTPPGEYRRRKDGAILLATEDSNGEPTFEMICLYDFYPTRILRQSGVEAAVDERSMWRAHLPRLGTTDMELQQGLISDQRKLHAYLLAKGVYVSPDQSKAMQFYMSAYLQKLAAEADREKLYDRMGWHNDRKEFVLGNQVVTADGKLHKHEPNRSVKAVTKEGVYASGSLDGWRQAMQFYDDNQYAGHRMFIYASFGAPLFHMNDTGMRGVLMTASGASGRGKTTCLKACGSIWGEPDSLILNGNRDGSTINALYESLGTYHSLPFLWDDITERDPDEIRRVLLNISQGAGKVRMKDGAGLNDRKISWETIVLASANTDDVSRIMTSGKDVDPHLMRLIGVEFSLINADAKAKAKADNFIRGIKGNFGHAGPVFMQHVVSNYVSIRTDYINNIAKVDQLLNSSNASAERYWSATVAAAYTAGKIAMALNLLPVFDIEADLAWMVGRLSDQRIVINEGKQSPVELFSEFLEAHITNTLVLSAKTASNLDNVSVRPHGALLIRHEVDAQTMYVARTAIMDYCTEAKTSFRQLEQSLVDDGVIVQRNAQKVLGSDTVFAKGQTRSWKIDARKIGPAPALQAAGSNVTPINGSKAA